MTFEGGYLLGVGFNYILLMLSPIYPALALVATFIAVGLLLIGAIYLISVI